MNDQAKWSIVRYNRLGTPATLIGDLPYSVAESTLEHVVLHALLDGDNRTVVRLGERDFRIYDINGFIVADFALEAEPQGAESA